MKLVLGIDNLVFIAILADKLPPKERNRARLTGLILAMVMRLGMLSLLSWMVTLTRPLFTIYNVSLSGRDLILLVGGVFLLFKATMELHERLEGRPHHQDESRIFPSFWVVVTQIVILDAIFSLDSVITAVGIVSHLPVMMAAVVIAVLIMVWGVASADRIREQTPDRRRALPVIFADDRPLADRGKCRLPYSEGIPLRLYRLLDFDRDVQPDRATQFHETYGANPLARPDCRLPFCAFSAENRVPNRANWNRKKKPSLTKSLSLAKKNAIWSPAF